MYHGRAALVLGLLAAREAAASYGDTSARRSRRAKSPALSRAQVLYQSMVADSVARGCDVLPLSLRLLRWTCLDESRYRVMHQLTDAALAGEELYDLRTYEVTQFHGKWPFYRLAGMQEPASVAFSLANLAVHAYWWRRLDARLPRDLPRPLRARFRVLPLVGLNAWIWSAVFHARDWPWTERADYFSAALGMLYSSYYAIVRTFGLFGEASVAARRAYAVVLGAVYCAHVGYLTLWRFNYAYNMQFNVAIGLAHNALWYAWAARTRAPHALRGVVVLTGLLGLSALELFDFPPLWRALDAHALWHASTALALVYWYGFLLRDVDFVAATAPKARRA